ncbi:MAG TPA: hypothetical protein VJX74_05185 [Blastocatellia bacterium]|nr:hypothetical protein [Blastocatellia bacterium]
MSESALKLSEFERQVVRRKRMLALQDRVALAALVSCVIAAGFVLFARMREGGSIPWAVLAVIFALELGAFAWHWFKTRATKQEAAFLIDDKLDLEDRVSTAHQIIKKGGPQREVEFALIDDAAERVTDKRASLIVPYRIHKWYALSLVGVAALVAALMIPERALPGGVAIAEARENIQSAGEQLEQAGEEIALAAPAESETAKLAREQAELGRAFRRSPETREEALKKLSLLEDRVRQRHSELASTRADEIVNTAQRRLRSVLRALPKQQNKEAEMNAGQEASDESAEPDDTAASANANTARTNNRGKDKKQITPKPSESQMAKGANSNANKESDSKTIAQQGEANANKTGPAQSASNQKQPEQPVNAQASPQAQAGQSEPQNRPQQPVSGKDANAGNSQPPASQPPAASDGNQKPDGQPSSEQNEQKPDANKNQSNGLTGLMAEQAAKALPNMSAELLKRAAELRAGQIKPEDLKGLQQAAQFLANDLTKLAQSKELQQAAMELAKQITPEQLEQFARALGNQEQLKRELEAAARLILQNQEAKAMVAGMAQKFAKLGEQFGGRERGESRNRQQGNNQSGEPSGNGAAGGGKADADARRGREFTRMSGGLTERTDGAIARTGQGRETKISGNVQRGNGGEYLYLKSKAGAGATRAPYSSAYPQYRREAERSVERSQVPPRMRSVVRSYFDAINPDATKKP